MNMKFSLCLNRDCSADSAIMPFFGLSRTDKLSVSAVDRHIYVIGR